MHMHSSQSLTRQDRAPTSQNAKTAAVAAIWTIPGFRALIIGVEARHASVFILFGGQSILVRYKTVCGWICCTLLIMRKEHATLSLTGQRSSMSAPRFEIAIPPTCSPVTPFVLTPLASFNGVAHIGLRCFSVRD